MSKETLINTIFITLVIAYISWAGLQIVANASGIIENKTSVGYIVKTLDEIKDDVRFIREKIR